MFAVSNLCIAPLAATPAKAQTWQLSPGDALIIAGASGCGKSTLLRTLADLDKAESGTITWEDRPHTEWPAPVWRRMVRYIGSSSSLLGDDWDENMLGTENPQSLFKAFNLDDDIPEKNMDTLSEGEAHRLSIIRALTFPPNPRVILCDEPSAHVDDDTKNSMQKYFESLSNMEKIIIIVSHDDSWMNFNAKGSTYSLQLPEGTFTKIS
jgi:ABC-type iron transport system FetAB ATPase subunit